MLGADHLRGGGGGVEDSVCTRIFFPPRRTRQIFFSCKSAAQDIFFPIYLAAGYTKACKFTYKECITAPKPKTCRDRVEYSKMGGGYSI
jgi:hypothetical protein